MKISVALCTYNGAKYLQQQLESIATQTRAPDELVVCDDASADETAAILKRFAEKSSFTVRIFENETNLGLVKNFERAIEKCTGDVIALSDQDDVWLPQKLKRLEQIFASEPDTGLVFSNATVADENLKPTGWSLWDMTFRRRDRRRFTRGKAVEVLLEYNVVTGAAMAFRSSFRDVVLPIPELTDFIHDGWISLVIATRSRLRFVDEPWIKYRQHADQQLGAGLAKWKMPRQKRHHAYIENRLSAIERLEEIREVFRERDLFSGANITSSDLDALIEDRREYILTLIEHFKIRAALPDTRIGRIPVIVREVSSGRYRKYSRGLLSAAVDLFSK